MTYLNSILKSISGAGKAKKKSVASSRRQKNRPVARVYVLGNSDFDYKNKLVKSLAPSWLVQELESSTKDLMHFSTDVGPVWIVRVGETQGTKSHNGRLEESDFASAKNQLGSIFLQIKAQKIDSVNVEFGDLNREAILGAFVGIEVSQYDYKSFNASKKQRAGIELIVGKSKLSQAEIADLAKQASLWGHSINWARHLVNMPPNLLNPKSFADLAKKILKNNKSLKLEVWDSQRLKRENMGLHLGVGQGALHPPCLVKIHYRPQKTSRLAPVALVGKGITFDSGGLDIKPSSGMRLMKKDMGGAAAVFAVMLWASLSDYPAPLDGYLGLAENSVDANSMRPSDVLRSRNGIEVEIHNTDAEGRLVLADVIDVAVTQKQRPRSIIDVATLTGAIKVGLGSDIAGLFANDDRLAEKINSSGFRAGDLNWRMPLFSKYTSNFSSPFADVVNATDGFGGAITAALFLEKFVRQTPWAHLDIYAWTDKAQGPLGFAGGSGQAVSCLIDFLRQETK